MRALPSAPIPKRAVRFGDFQVDFVLWELRRNGERIKIQEQPLKVLAILLSRPGDLITREELRQGLWSDETFIDVDRGLNTAVNRLRYALSDSAEHPQFVETVGRHGYRFIGSAVDTDHVEPSLPPQPQESPSLEAVLPSNATGRSEAETPQPGEERSIHDVTELPLSGSSQHGWPEKALFFLLGSAVVLALMFYEWQGANDRGLNLRESRILKLTNSGRIEDVAVAPDGAYVVYTLRDGKGSGLWLRHMQSKSDIQILPSEEVDFRGLTFSPEGNSIYYVRTRKEIGSIKDLYSIPVLGGAPRLLTRDIDSPVSFDPQGSRFVYTRGFLGPPDGNEIRVAKADGTEDRLLRKITNTQGNFQVGATWSPDGRTIAVSLMLIGEHTKYVLDAISTADGSVREVISNEGVIGRPLWLPDSRSVLVDIDDSTGRGQLWVVSIPQGQRRRVTNDVANWGPGIDATRDARTVAAVQWTLSANIWEANAADPTAARQISFGEVPLVAARGFQGSILTVSGDGQLWALEGEDKQRRQFSALRDVGPPIPCARFVIVPTYETKDKPPADAGSVAATKLASGRIVVLRSYQAGAARLMRVDSDGLNPTLLASGLVYSPTCSPDGKYLFYISMKSPQKIIRVPVEGGSSEILGDIPGTTIRGTMTTSPDGRFLAFPYDSSGPSPGLRLGVVSADRGQLVKSFEAPMGIYRESCVRWSPDGTALHYLLTTGDVTNIWEQPLSGGGARQITHFTSGRMFDFNWSTDGTTMLMSRGGISSDVVLLAQIL